ncbi:MAG: Uma2 family endonuclease [Lachnospiraceae bacterium]|nr:Uma2 family endonuclease [Lachnospiraceae bacterium]
MTIEEMRNIKKEMGYSYEQLAELSGIPLGTLQKALNGTTDAPRRKTVERLEQFFLQLRRAMTVGEYYHGYQNAVSEIIVKESGAAYLSKKQGEYTVADYEAFPPEERVELIDGRIFFMEAPTIKHQRMLGILHSIFYRKIKEKERPCEVFVAPVDVQLDKNDYTMIQPDLMVVCNRDIITEKRLVGAPDFVIEVLSPSTRRKDLVEKLHKYQEAGVREFWAIDPDKELVLTFCFERDNDYAVYSFDNIVPVGISGGELSVDFREIRKEIAL